MEFFLLSTLVFLGYFIGSIVSRSVPDELEEGATTMLLVREGSFLAAITVVAYTLSVPYWFIIPFVVLIAMYYWSGHEQAYPWILPVIIALGNPIVIGMTFLTSFVSGALSPVKTKEMFSQQKIFAVITVLIIIFRFFQ